MNAIVVLTAHANREMRRAKSVARSARLSLRKKSNEALRNIKRPPLEAVFCICGALLVYDHQDSHKT